MVVLCYGNTQHKKELKTKTAKKATRSRFETQRTRYRGRHAFLNIYSVHHYRAFRSR